MNAIQISVCQKHDMLPYNVVCTNRHLQTLIKTFRNSSANRCGRSDYFTIVNFPTNSSIFDTCPLTLHNYLDAEILQFYHPNYNPKANCSLYEPLTKLVDGRVIVDRRARGYDCSARCLISYKDVSYIAETDKQIINKPDVYLLIIDSVSSYMSKRDKQIINKPDVYLLIIDSVSSYMSKRSLPKTLEYLKNMGGIQMEFLNKVGEGSRSNGFPLLFGKLKLIKQLMKI
ncbi:hypothetical protein DICVIV_07399 [Dictyocaulus viviparus]|uniref:Uncharacterized protein n=1 Tax=Dictyocaulus viviparus TaxID=29172 RepID=A0A0D8XVZ4_DICVI|nr:hypothetical protein DICVIV_07399 [Dictyocaulus viviparus]